MSRVFFRKKELAAAAAIALAGAAAWIFISARGGSEPVSAHIFVNGQELAVIDLDTQPDGEFSLEGLEQITFGVKDGRIAFISSDCPDKICIHTGFVHRESQTAACLPNRCVLVIERTEKKERDR